jgi:two-component system response regulator QseB
MPAVLIIERGAPFPPMTRIALRQGSTAVGRRSADSAPDLAFESACISRRHLVIEAREGAYFATEGGSKNGTLLNGAALEAGLPRELREGDRLSLAGDAAVLLFSVEEAPDTASLEPGRGESKVRFDDARREILVRGMTIELSGNLYSLFRVLYVNRGRAVSGAEIREAVWPERARDEGGAPNAADSEVNTLVMRLRKKLSGADGLISNLRGYGYMLDIED